MVDNTYFHNSNLIEGVDDSHEDVNSLLAWNCFLTNCAGKGLTVGVLMTLHDMLMEEQLSELERGHVRTINVTVGGRICPPPYLAGELLRNWLFDMQEPKQHDPRVMHIRFEKIHPFVDGNGRTGRMLMWWHEMKLDCEPTLIKFEERYDYYKWFK